MPDPLSITSISIKCCKSPTVSSFTFSRRLIFISPPSGVYLKAFDSRFTNTLSKLLGQTDTEGQISQIEITESFLESQIKEAIILRQKNEKLYTRLGTIMGLTIVIVLA